MKIPSVFHFETSDNTTDTFFNNQLKIAFRTQDTSFIEKIHTFDHGLISSTPTPSKSVTFRVAIDAYRERAIAAI
jgi:hypothetical protein